MSRSISAPVVNALVGGTYLLHPGEDVPFLLPSIMRRGGVDLAHLSVALDDDFATAARRLAALLHGVDEDNELDSLVVRSAADLANAKAAGRPAILAGFQATEPLEGKLSYLHLFHSAGLRCLQLTYQRTNLVGSGCGEAEDGGLTRFGRDVVRAMNELGILVDLSHCGRRTALEAIEASESPVAFTHVNAFAQNQIPRNKTDEELLAVASSGGVIGVNAIARFLSSEGTTRGATLDEFVDQIEYMCELVGVDHVGLGLDVAEGMTDTDFERRKETWFARFPELAGVEFERENYYVRELSSMADVPRLTEALENRGFSAEKIEKVLGGNFVRLLEEVLP